MQECLARWCACAVCGARRVHVLFVRDAAVSCSTHMRVPCPGGSCAAGRALASPQGPAVLCGLEHLS